MLNEFNMQRKQRMCDILFFMKKNKRSETAAMRYLFFFLFFMNIKFY